MRKLYLILFLLLTFIVAKGQNPFEEYGFEVDYATLSKGVFDEEHDKHYTAEIAGVIFDTRNNKIVYKVDCGKVDNTNPEISSRFISMDPLAEKYYHISPYAYCANNPINNIDLRGDSITVLNLGYGTNQHMGMLIQNDAGKWQYYSVNGDNVYSSGSHTGGRKFDDIAVGEFDTPQQFMDSKYNSQGHKDDREGSNKYGYNEGYVIATTSEQDKIIAETFGNISANKEYGIISNNCASAVQKSLEVVGIDTKQAQRIPANRTLGEASYIVKTNPFIPSVAFNTIIRNNPQGTYVTKTK